MSYRAPNRSDKGRVMEAAQSNGDNHPRDGTTDIPKSARPGCQFGVAAALRYVIVAAALLALLPMLTFACGAIVAGLGRNAVRIVLDVGLAALVLDALAFVLAIVALAVTALRPVPTSPPEKRRIRGR
ncbi:MAG: hypothetical protein M3008_07020 [Chloroflexota bacterium]|nr:hypothetical protein [Chloroflexota bacterium]